MHSSDCFLFVFNPAKPAVYSEFTPKGLNYSRKWVDQFLTKLDELGVRYIDNTKTLLSEKQAGKQVFNIKYDPNHWNYLGALIGTNAILAEMQKIIEEKGMIE